MTNKKKLLEMYSKIRNLEELLDYKDDLVAKRDHAIFLIKKGTYTENDFDKDKEFRFSEEYLDTGLDILKYFHTVYEVNFKENNVEQKLKKIVNNLKLEIAKRDELINIREKEIEALLSDGKEVSILQSKTTESPISLFKKSIYTLKRFGIKELIRRIFKKVGNILTLRKRSIVIIESKRKRIAYVVNALAVSGGMQIVIRHVNELKKRGYDVMIITFAEYKPSKWLNVDVPVHFLPNCNEDFISNIDIMVATHWSTVPYVLLSGAKRKVYFVQSDERRFILEKKYKDNLINYIEETYKSNMEFMTEAIWIQRWLKEEFNKDAYYVPNGLDTDVFYKTEPIEPKGEKPRVLIEGQINYWLKGTEEAYEAVKDLDCELWIVSSWGKPPKYWKYTKFFEKVPFEKMKNLYSSCDIFLKMSKVEGFFGPPMEAMACGCAVVVGKVSGYDEYIVNNENALVVESGDITDARKAVQKLMKRQELRDKLIKTALRVPYDWNWSKSIDLLEKMIDKERVQKYYSEDFPERYSFQEEKDRISIYVKKREEILFK